jgi:hypothetical protein
MLNPARWPLSYVQGATLKGSGGDSVRLLNHRALGPLSRSTEHDERRHHDTDPITPPGAIP